MVKFQRRRGMPEKGDPRILGSSEFVIQVIDEADRTVQRQLPGSDPSASAGEIIRHECAKRKVAVEALCSGSRRRAVSDLRRYLALKLVNELGMPLAESRRQLGVTTSAIAQILRRSS